MPHPDQLAAQRWHAVVDDMAALGSWCVMNVDKTPVAADPDRGEVWIARYLSEAAARQIVEQHNADLAGIPAARPGRYRVRPEDTAIFDRIGASLDRAQDLLAAADRAPAWQPRGDPGYLQAVLHEVVAALNQLTEATIRVRGEPDPQAAAISPRPRR